MRGGAGQTKENQFMHSRRGGVRPTGQERLFGVDELIVSETDARGVIRYANDVFLRVSAYPETDVIGQPHSVIRHPEMPRGVFHLLWERISAGQELFAYIVDLAADGAPYWVLAHVTPTFGRNGEILGYHSNRRLPERAAIAALEPIYASMRKEEARHGNARGCRRGIGGAARRDACRARADLRRVRVGPDERRHGRFAM